MLCTILLALGFSISTRATEEVFAFRRQGELPMGKLLQANDGNFYGTTSFGGSNDIYGTVFKMTPSGTVTTLISFAGTNGAAPSAGLIQASDGALYGTTKLGGTIGSGYGTIFKITTNGVFTSLYSFGDTNGSNPECDLLQASDGKFYGTTFNGGANGQGTVFRMTPGGVLTTVAAFVVSVGSNPAAGLIQAADGNFYGTASAGGANGTGTIFKMTPGGILSALYTFSPVNPYNQNLDGAFPKAALCEGTDGSLYGTTSGGGTANPPGYTDYGAIFKVTTNGTFTTLAELGSTNAPGAMPLAPLIEGSDGNFYGTTSGGIQAGATNYINGTVFRMSPAGAVTTLVALSAGSGFSPAGGLCQGSDSNFYGTTEAAGPANSGTVFRITSGGVLTVVNSFVNTNGRYPRGVTQGVDGNFYGITFNDGPAGAGTVYRISPGGVFTQLFAFDWQNGSNPNSPLLRASDGNLYGTTFAAGVFGRGIVFKVTPGGAVTTVATLVAPSTDSAAEASLIEGTDGNFYGTTRDGGVNNSGTVFKVTPGGTLTQLASLPSGSNPYAGLVEGADGNFYGTARGGGTYNLGMVYRVTPAGVVTPWASFSLSIGSNPEAPLTLGQDGNFYGTASSGGAKNEGAAFKMTPAGVLTTLASFGDELGQNPRGPLLEGRDGNFYGTTTSYSYLNLNTFEIVIGAGTLFKMTPAGVVTTLEIFNKGALFSFPPNNGLPYRSPLIQALDGNIYGTTYEGGSAGGGNIFRVFTDLSYQTLGNALVLSWPTNSPGFTLQTSSSLGSPALWTDATNVPVLVGSRNVVTNPITTGTMKFFRLKK